MSISLETPSASSPGGQLPGKLALDGAGSHRGEVASRKFLGSVPGRVLLVFGLFLPTVLGLGVWLSRPASVPPDVKLRSAEELLAEGRLAEARDLALELQGVDYRDPGFPGGVEYVLGMAAFREALLEEHAFQEQLYLVAIENLKVAEERSVRLDVRPQWAYALAVSLSRVGLLSEARPLLEDEVLREGAFGDGAPEKVEAWLLLAEYLLGVKTEDSLRRAEGLNQLAIDGVDAGAVGGGVHRDQIRARLQKVQIKLGVHKNGEAKEALEWVRAKLDDKEAGVELGYESLREIRLLYAQTLMEDGRLLREGGEPEEKVVEVFRSAVAVLRDLSKGSDLDQAVARQAAYLLGVCFRELGDFENALGQFRMVSGHGASQEATASHVAAGDVLRTKGGHDGDALVEYGLALRSIQSLDEYRNRWMDQKGFQEAIRRAWESWIADKRFDRAIALAELMSPLFPEEMAFEYSAVASQRWAEFKQGEYDGSPVNRREEMWEEVRRRWNRSGQAHERWAESLAATVRYGDALWASAEHYVHGQQHAKALVQLDKFIETNPTRFLPTALVLRGRTLMSLGRFQEAIRSFETVLADHATDVSAVQAEYLIGLSHLELNEPAVAEKKWREILQNSKLKPDALEWQASLLGVARIRFRDAEAGHDAIDRARRTEQLKLQGEKLKEADRKYESAIGDFDQYLSRYPASQDNPWVMYDLAVAYQHSADLFDWARLDAPNENAKLEASESLVKRLAESHRYYRESIREFESLREKGRLDKLGQSFLKNGYFFSGDVLVRLERYQDAIDAYTVAANRYPKEPETLGAYVEVATCYEHLKKPDEARSMIEQAKVILRDMPPEVFNSPSSQISKVEWEKRLNWVSGSKQ